MLSCLLAPIPVEHVEGAREAFETAGRVAFATGNPTSDYSGSSTWQLFKDLEQEGEFGKLAVFIHASLSGQPASHPHYQGQTASWRATLAGYELSKAGKHLRPEERPKSALLTDVGPSVGFWVVENLVQLQKSDRIPLAKFRTFRAGKPGVAFSGVLRGPVRAFCPV